MTKGEIPTMELDDQIKTEANAALAELGMSDTIATQPVFDNYTSRWFVHLLNRSSNKRYSVIITTEEALGRGLKETIEQKLRELK